jgi:hypothetical protein
VGIPAHVALGVVELAVCPCGGAPWTGVNHVLPRPQRHHRVVPLCRRAMGVGGPSLCVLRGPQVHSRLLREASVAQRWKKSRSTCDTTGVCASCCREEKGSQSGGECGPCSARCAVSVGTTIDNRQGARTSAALRVAAPAAREMSSPAVQATYANSPEALVSGLLHAQRCHGERRARSRWEQRVAAPSSGWETHLDTCRTQTQLTAAASAAASHARA